ncbi:universal stress protein [Streptomyces netropsis]|uniref:universal stress protein n=1 Tax=Streptomyces netropsis TaxID=55404 RepID=UPI0037A3D4CC
MPRWSPERKNIVLGLDLSRPCDPLTAFAFEEAAAWGALLRVVHVWNECKVYGYAAAPLDPRLMGDLRTEEARGLTRALTSWRQTFPGVRVEEQVLDGAAAQRLIETGEAADLLVVGRRKRRPAVGARIGPVAHGVLHHAACPVAVVPHD